MEIAIVQWNDSNFGQGWRLKEGVVNEHVSPCVSCGIIVRKDEKEIVIALSLSPESYADTMTIPMGCVTRIRRLKVKEGIK